MKFLLDAQVPPSLKNVFIENGYDCIHTLDLELKNETTDELINQISISEQRILITKDSDFFDSFLIHKKPFKLILVKVVNVSKKELTGIFINRFAEIIKKIKEEDMILLSNEI